ncbi:hypothetical protein IFM47457_01759 [Aspergillus lentulus]|nr:hypothetical protein IFM47457_01759 [Aspergillus lentulus]
MSSRLIPSSHHHPKISSAASKPLSCDTDPKTNPYEDIINIGANGSPIEFYLGFEAEICSTMRDVPKIG